MTEASEIRFDLGKLDAEGARAIVDALRLDLEAVTNVDYDAARATLTVQLSRPEAAERIRAFVGDMARTQRKLPRKVRRSTRARELVVRDIDAALAASPDLFRLEDGLCAMSGSLLDLFRFFEAEFRRLARSFDAREHHYPVMVPTSLLSEVGYFDHFPQHATFCTHLRGSLPVLEAVSAGLPNGEATDAPATDSDTTDSDTADSDTADSDTTDGDTTDGGTSEERALDALLRGRLRKPRHVLTPAVCLPCYRTLRDVVLAPGEVRTFTMQNQVFRFEGAGFRPLARAWDFSVRDIVFFGDASQVEGLREEAMERTLAICERLDLEVTLELANDPFFLDQSRSKAMYQRLTEVKYELLFPLPHRSERLAASSFNLHRSFYTAVYGTRRADAVPVESACMGFGLERWVYGFLSQKGLDPLRWPPEVQAFLADRGRHESPA